MKKIYHFSICIVLLSLIFNISVCADSDSVSGKQNSDVFPAYCGLFGDADSDGELTVKDARICLRACAKLVELTDEQQYICNISSIDLSEVNTLDARRILKAVAKTDKLRVTTFTLNYGTSKLKNMQIPEGKNYEWKYTVISGDADIQITKEKNTDIYGITAVEMTSEVLFTLVDKNTNTSIYEFELEVINHNHYTGVIPEDWSRFINTEHYDYNFC